MLFMSASVSPTIRALYNDREEDIERVRLDIERERQLIDNTASWRERRVEAEAITSDLESQILTISFATSLIVYSRLFEIFMISHPSTS